MRYLLAGIVVFLVLQGCQYSPDEDNFQEKSIPDPSAIDLTEFSTEDTLFIHEVTPFSISVLNYDNRQLYEARVTVDGNHLAQTNGSSKLSFQIYPLSYSTGVHTLEIVFDLSSGSNSLADQLDAERLSVSKKWKFEVDNDTPTMVENFDVSYRDGAVEIKWNKYNRKNFSYYRFSHGYYYRQDIKDINTTSVIDTTYVGGERVYYLQVYNHQDRFSPTASKTYKDDGLSINEVKIADQKFHIKWSKSKYHKAFKSYLIRDWKSSAPIEKTSITDTSITLSPAGIALGYTADVRISTVGKAYNPNSSNPLNDYPVETIKLYQGEKVLDHGVYKYVRSNNSLYTGYKGRALRLNADNLDTLAMTDQRMDFLDISKNGEYAYSIYSSILVKRNPQTLVDEKVIGNINNLVGQTNVSVTGFLVSGNNKIAIKTYGKFWIVDMTTSKVVHQGITVNSILKLSDDFNFIFDGEKLYGNNAGVYKSLLTPGSNPDVVFNANFPDEAIILRKNLNKVTIMKPTTNTVVREIQLKDYVWQVIVDEKTNLALIGGSDINQIYDLSMGTLKMDLRTGASSTFPFSFFNNRLYRGSYFISLDQYQP